MSCPFRVQHPERIDAKCGPAFSDLPRPMCNGNPRNRTPSEKCGGKLAGINTTGLSGDSSRCKLFLWQQTNGGIFPAAGVFRLLDLGDDKPTTATPAEQAGLQPAASTETPKGY